MTRAIAIPLVLALTSVHAAEPAPSPAPRTMAEVLAASAPADWRALDPENTLYLDLAAGRVVIELAPAFAPAHVANIKALVRGRYFDGLSINRAQDNYVVQWGDPDGDVPERRRGVGDAKRALAAEFDRPIAPDLPFTLLPDGDVYAPESGWSIGFPAARDAKGGRAWLTHCYGMVGAGRDNDADSGSGTDLYVVIGNAPRHLDRNVTLVGRVIQGIEILSTMPRGPGAMGFYDEPGQRTPIRSMRVAADVPLAERVALEVLRTDTATFGALVESRRNRREEWYRRPAGRIEVCNVPLPARASAQPAAPATNAAKPETNSRR